ncbi:MAG: PqqD family protein [Actinomycetota bacterium]
MPYRRSAGVTFEVSDGRAVLLDADGDTLTTLNPTGTRIWQDLDGRRDVGELAARLGAVHPEVPVETLRTDVEAFLDELGSDGLVEAVAGA